MMKKASKLAALLLALCMLFALAACGQTESKPTDAPKETPAETDAVETAAPSEEPKPTDPLEMLTAGYYCYKFTEAGYGDFGFFFHFYEEDPVLGSVFYAGLSNNRQNFAGTYTVEEADFAYACYPDRASATDDNVQPTEGTAPYTIIFYSWDGEELGKCGFDGEYFYNVMDEGSAIYSTGAAPIAYVYSSGSDDYAEMCSGELGVSFMDFVAVDEKTSTISIAHNKTYTDLVGAMIEGSWTVAENAEGGYDFTLVPNDESDTGAVLSTSADGSTATYTPDGGEPVEMVNTATTGPKEAYSFSGTGALSAYGIDAELTLTMFDDGSCSISASVQGSAMELDTGSYVLEGYTFSIDWAKAADAESSVDGSGTVTVPFTITGTAVGDIDTVLTLNK